MKSSGVASTKITGRKRRIFRALGFFISGLLILILAVPVWFPWVLRALAGQYGVEYAGYERVGYARFALNTVTFTNQAAEFRAARVELFTPTVWLWKRVTAEASAPYIQATRWRFIDKERDRGKEDPSSSVYTNFQTFEAAMAIIRKWVPKATLTDGVIAVSGQNVEIPAATWMRGTLTANFLLPPRGPSGTMVVKMKEARVHEIHFASDALDLDSTLRIVEDKTGLQIQSTHRWLTNRLEASARFGRAGALPEDVAVQADSFTIPAQQLNLPQYEDLTGSASLVWQSNQFNLNVAAVARPRQPGALPSVKLDLRAQGDTNSARIDAVRVSAPWLELELTEPIEVQFRSPYLLSASTLRISADLSQQPWFPAEGQLDGRASFQLTTTNFPAVSFALSGSGIAISNLQTRMLNLEGQLLWPWLDLSSARVEFADGAVAQLSGRFDATNQVVLDGRLHFQGWFGRDWLPAGYSYENASLSATFEGPLRNLSHGGELQLDEFASPRFKTLRAETQWQGKGLHLQRARVQVASGKSVLGFEGAIQADRPEKSFHVTALTLHKEKRPVFALASPFRIDVQETTQPGTNSTRALVCKIEAFHWIGEGGEIQLKTDLAWPLRGHLNSSIKALDPAVFDDFVNLPTPHLTLRQMKLSAAWTNRPIDGHLELLVEAAPAAGLPLRADLKLKGSRDGLSVEKLAIFSHTQLVAEAKGFLPIRFRPGFTADSIQFHETQPLKLEVSTLPTAFFWDEVAKWSGLRLHKPDLKMNLSGTWSSPQGEILLQAERIEFPGAKRQQFPAVDNLTLAVALDRNTVHLTNCQFSVQEQLVSLTGTIPLEKQFWALGRKNSLQPEGRLSSRPVSGLGGWKAVVPLDWQKVTARLRIKDAQLAPFASFLPDALSDQGELDADIALLPGARLDGELTLSGLRTRPLEAVGSISDITGRLKLAGRTARLESFSAAIAGQPVTAEGHVELPFPNWPRDAWPPFEVKLRGANVPLARTPELILRADLNAAITNALGTTPLISGAIRLRDGYYLSDLKDLVPGKMTTPARRPPYFSIEEEPFAGWRLNVAVQGDHFLKIRSPLFRGEVSANLTLRGTLKEPMALGEVKVDSGAVTFPFANLQVNQGLVTLASENPYRPQLFLAAKTRRIGYDIQMEITGPADEPVVQFFSSPPLSSEQIILMLTAGQMPRDAARLSTEQRAQGLAMFVGKNVLSQLGIGDADEERLTIRSGEEITEQGKPTYDVEYKLSKKWSLVGQYDRFNEYNAGIKWRIYSK